VLTERDLRKEAIPDCVKLHQFHIAAVAVDKITTPRLSHFFWRLTWAKLRDPWSMPVDGQGLLSFVLLLGGLASL
jgi:hypothetical protein